tara:strand:- start:95 stop:352 length:258 start_codon:yes stop_codon:yes gene_type:complete
MTYALKVFKRELFALAVVASYFALELVDLSMERKIGCLTTVIFLYLNGQPSKNSEQIAVLKKKSDCWSWLKRSCPEVLTGLSEER